MEMSSVGFATGGAVEFWFLIESMELAEATPNASLARGDIS